MSHNARLKLNRANSQVFDKNTIIYQKPKTKSNLKVFDNQEI